MVFPSYSLNKGSMLKNGNTFLLRASNETLNFSDRASEVSSIINCTHEKPFRIHKYFATQIHKYFATQGANLFSFWLILKSGNKGDQWQEWGVLCGEGCFPPIVGQQEGRSENTNTVFAMCLLLFSVLSVKVWGWQVGQLQGLP